jgi:hypothetical protein
MAILERKIDAKKHDAYKRFVKSKKVDDDTVRMAHDNPNHPMVKRMKNDKTYAKSNFKKALDMYKNAGVKESFVIPEDIPFKERNAFMGAAAAAHKSGKSHFNFGGKKHPVTMDKKVATKIADDADAMKAFLAKGGKITKLPPGKAQGYHGKDDPGKDMHGMMAKGDTKAMGTRKKVKSMEAVQDVDQKEGTDEAKRVVHSDKPDRLVTMKIKDPKKKSGENATMNPKLGNEKGKGAEMEQKESLTIRDKLMMVLEGDRSKHYKGATAPEEMDNNLKGAGAKKMKADIQGNAADPDLEKKSHDDASKAGRAGPSMKARPNDKKDGDKKMQTPDDITKKGKGTPEMKSESTNSLKATLSAYADMAILEAEGNVTTRHDVIGDTKNLAIAAVRKKAGPNVAVKHHGMTPNGDHDIGITGHPKHVMKFVNHHEDGKYSLDHAGHAKYKKDFGG